MKVSELQVGQTVRILTLKRMNQAYRQRLIAMGLIPGTEFTVMRMAPLGDPIEIRVRGAALSLRKHEANILEITEVI